MGVANSGERKECGAVGRCEMGMGKGHVGVHRQDPASGGRGSASGRVRAGPAVEPWLSSAAVVLALLTGATPGRAQAVGARDGAQAVASTPALSLPPAKPAQGAQLVCERCHSLPNLGYREGPELRPRSFTVAPAIFRASAHAKVGCPACHTLPDRFPHPPTAQRPRVTCDQDCHAVDRAGRPYNHRDIVRQFSEGVHGKLVGARGRAAAPDPDNPTCLTCHGAGDAHAIVPVAEVSRRAKVALCADCHEDRAVMRKHGVSAEAVASYRRSFHYKGLRFGDTATAICTDCHSPHRILPASDSRSTVSPAALTKTCGQARCHQGAGRNFSVSGANHLDLRVERSGLLWFEEKFFLLLTAGTMLMLVVGIVLDVQRKFGWIALVARAGRALVDALERLRPSLARSGRRGLRVARRLLID